ncbi:MAG TPA: ABC transporter permease [Burkholderiales bacterium]|nr:ABC transporter permease [Burkholderiales bacterium]
MSESSGTTRLQPQLRHVSSPETGERVELSGPWILRAFEEQLGELSRQLAEYARDANRHWDLTNVTRIDHAGALLLWRAWGGQRVRNLTLRPEHEGIFSGLSAPRARAPKPARDWRAPISALGDWLLDVSDHLLHFVLLVGRIAIDTSRLSRQPRDIPWLEISANIYRTGAQALGITALVGFLVGIVLSYLSAQQLKTFGADIFIINLLGVSIIRELGPVLAAVLIAGRSGSAMTAQLGVMRVTEELDAMTVMGIPHTVRLILPKVLALAVSLPLVVAWTCAVALFGGMIAAQWQLGIPYSLFLVRLPEAVPIANLWLGLGKSVVFGMAIALIACHYGLRIEPNTESLGSGTTDSVVTAITMVIIVDAAFAVMFSDVGSFL